ncbi:hypothetical protein SAMN04487939_101960 [Lysobacter sp. yr284]|uniref:hypothetical protein n=1 Tax=Lysobacter sp. yr284 TaxID=1761791 RepID=UPI00089C7750|nr:hypothetical protein [Lysobacter sp. yr284]SDY34812.1 hypothetical protein SAMN04487939_101960 [Lysobacter sp. yr284]
MTATFQSLAAHCGIALPPMLERLLADGRTRYGSSREDWQANWFEYTLRARPLLSCVYDLEWIGPERARQIAEEWLDPRFQDGRAFLPFAISGAGDAYCLMRTATGEAAGAGMVWHDRGDSAMDAAGFEQFVFARLVESALDFEHLLDDFSPMQARECVLANLQAAASYLSDAPAQALRSLAAAAGPVADDSTGMIDEDVAARALSVYPAFESPRFAVVPRWECG